MANFSEYIHSSVEQRAQKNLLRERSAFSFVSANRLIKDGKSYINFSSNDYLGLATDFKLDELIVHTDNSLISSGAMASPLVTGHSESHQILTEKLLSYMNAPDSHQVLLFSSGYAANQGVLNALFKDKSEDSYLLQDKLNHASLMDAGIKLHNAKHLIQKRFKHNDVKNLEKLLQTNKQFKKQLVVTEGVFSMDGDVAPLKSISLLCKQHDTLLMVDDAHGFGVHSKNSLNAAGLSINDVDIYVVTFGKALGAQGAAVIADKQIIQYLENFSKEYIYSTHLSPLQCIAVTHNLAKVTSDSQDLLQANIRYFRAQALKNSLPLLESKTAIQPILIGDEGIALAVSDSLKEQGVWVPPIRYPTVKKGASRLRVTITASHNTNDINALVLAVCNALKKLQTERK